MNGKSVVVAVVAALVAPLEAAVPLSTEPTYLSCLENFDEVSGCVELDLSAVQVSGTIPTELGNITTLEAINLQNGNGQKLNGALPTELGRLTRLDYFFVSNNQLTGTFPSEMGLLSALTHVTISQNRFSAIPAIALSPTPLVSFTATRNSFTAIPTEIGLWTSVTFVNIATCRSLVGTIPTEVRARARGRAPGPQRPAALFSVLSPYSAGGEYDQLDQLQSPRRQEKQRPLRPHRNAAHGVLQPPRLEGPLDAEE